MQTASFWLFNRLHWRHLLQTPLSSGLTLLGVALGVAVVLAIQLTSQTAVQQFKESVTLLAGSANLEVVPQTADRLSEAKLFPQLTLLWQQDAVLRPVIDRVVVVPAEQAASGKPQVLRVNAINMLGDTDFRETTWIEGGAPESYLHIFQRGRVYLGEALAQQLGVSRVGDTFRVWVDEHEARLQVAGILAKGDLTGAYAGQVAFMDIGPAQELFSMAGSLNRVELIVPEAEREAIAATLNKALEGQGLAVQRPERRGERVEQLMQSYHYNLTALSLIALLVGGFLIYNTLSITVIRRKGQLATLRALGMKRRQVIGLFLLEALALGGIGSLLGVGLGLVLAQSSVESVGRTLQELYTGQGVSSLQVSWEWPVATFLLGVGLSLLGALAPALEAARVEPAIAMRQQSQEPATSRWPLVLAAMGLLLGGLAWWASAQPPVNGVPVWGYVSSTCMVFGLAMLVPVGLKFILKGLASLLRAMKLIPAYLAVTQLRQALGRSAVAVASLGIAIGMQLSMTTMIHSFRESVTLWVNQSLKADVFVQPLASKVSREAAMLPVKTVRLIQQVPGIEATDPFLERSITWNNTRIKLGVGDFETFLSHGAVRFVDGEPFQQVIERALAPGAQAAIVSEPLAVKHGLSKGQTLTLPTPTGAVTLTIEGIYHDFASDQGYVVIPRQLFADYFPEQGQQVNSIALYAQAGVSPDELRERISKALPANTLLDIRTNDELRSEVLRVFDQTFAITYGMQGIALLVAVLAVWNTLMALVLEHRKELGVLRYLGTSLKQVGQLVLTQAWALAGLGFGAGSVLGYALALLLVHVINRQAFGWSVVFDVPVLTLSLSLVWLLLSATLAALWPLWQAKKLSPPQTLRGPA